MANIQENIGARNGYSEGMDATTVPIKLRVLIDDDDYTTLPDGTRITPNPIHLVQLNATNAGHTFYLGASHPWDDTAVVRRWTIDDQKTPGHFIISVHFVRYTTPFFGPTNEWVISIRGTSITEHVKTALGITEPVSIRKFLAGSLQPGLPTTSQAVPIGTPKYLPMGVKPADASSSPPAGAEHRTTTYDADGNAQTLWLKKTEQHNDEGTDVDLQGLIVMFKRTVAHYSISSTGALAGYVKAVNSASFYGADPHHVMLDDLSIEPISMDIIGQRVPGRAWAISLSFLWSKLLMYPLVRVDHYPGDDGYVSPVFPVNAETDEDPVTSAWDLPHRADFNALMTSLASIR